MKFSQIILHAVLNVSLKFGIILAIFTRVTRVLSNLHLRMRRRKLPYDFDDFDMGSSEA